MTNFSPIFQLAASDFCSESWLGIRGVCFCAISAFVCLYGAADAADAVPSMRTNQQVMHEFLDNYCSKCHNDERFSGDWSLSMVDAYELEDGSNTAAWERILRVTRDGDMPPAGKRQPSALQRSDFTHRLQAGLDGYAAGHPDPGRATLRRLNRAEYTNAIRDLLALDIDLAESLPTDDSGYGFDNIADVLSVSSTLMDRYFAIAGEVSRLAVGVAPEKPTVTTYEITKDGSILNQGIPAWNERSSDELPFDSRGGGVFKYYAPHSGVYEISGFLNANTNNEIDRLEVNRHALRLQLPAGPHSIGMSFRRDVGLDERVQVPRNNIDIVPLPVDPPKQLTLDFVVDGHRVGSTQVPSYYLSPRYAQRNFLRDVLQIDIIGPLKVDGRGSTLARKRIFRCHPDESTLLPRDCAREVLAPLARHAWRRPVGEEDLTSLLDLFDEASRNAKFEQGIAVALQALLVSPRFLFVIENDSPDLVPGSVRRLTDIEFASRLSLFIWSSLPDAELLALAESNELRQPEILEGQITRMLADRRADALTDNFAGQWLYLRNLEHHRPDVIEYPNFDARLRSAMREETERFFARIVTENRSILDFINADYTFLNERLAEHYGIEGVSGPGLRRVALNASSGRGGLLGQGSLLTVTSYGNHTSPVRRGKWILDSLLAAPPPPPPPNVAALVQESRDGRALNAREQMAMHREDPACAACHVKMDPLGMALEQFDAVGAFRLRDAGQLIDASSTFPGGHNFTGLSGLRDILLDRRDQFTRAFVEQMMTYALGRGIEAQDGPELRSVAKAAADNDYQMHTIIHGIVNSFPFNNRRVSQL